METLLTQAQAEDFLFHEARLIDEREFDKWLALFTGDARYWAPSAEGAEPTKETPIIYDDMETLRDRIWRIQHPAAHSQSPPARTRHLISNVQVEQRERGICRLYSNFVIYEARLKAERSFAGCCEHDLRPVEGEWRIALKKIWLINRETAFYNLTFIL